MIDMDTGIILIWVLSVLLALLLFELYRKGTTFEQPTDDSPPMTGNIGFTRSYIVTHTDFDGFASGALLLRHMTIEIGIVFATPRTIDRVIQQVAMGLTAGDAIYIADLALPPEKESALTPIMEKCKNRDVLIRWYDHHQWPAGLKERIAEIIDTLVINTSVNTAAKLIRPILPTDDPIADRILRFVCRSSLSEDKKWDENWRYLLSEVIRLKNMDLSQNVLRILSSGANIPTPMEQLVRRGKKRETMTSKHADYHHRQEKTVKNLRFIIIDVRPKRIEQDSNGKQYYVLTSKQPTVMVGALACKTHNADFCLILWNNFRYSLYRGVDRTIDFSPLFPGITINSFRYDITGHAYAASVRAQPTRINQLRSLIACKLPEEVNVLIRYLKENL